MTRMLEWEGVLDAKVPIVVIDAGQALILVGRVDHKVVFGRCRLETGARRCNYFFSTDHLLNILVLNPVHHVHITVVATPTPTSDLLLTVNPINFAFITAAEGDTNTGQRPLIVLLDKTTSSFLAVLIRHLTPVVVAGDSSFLGRALASDTESVGNENQRNEQKETV